MAGDRAEFFVLSGRLLLQFPVLLLYVFRLLTGGCRGVRGRCRVRKRVLTTTTIYYTSMDQSFESFRFDVAAAAPVRFYFAGV